MSDLRACAPCLRRSWLLSLLGPYLERNAEPVLGRWIRLAVSPTGAAVAAPLVAAVSPSSLPQSTTGRLEVRSVEARSYLHMMISSRFSAALCGSSHRARTTTHRRAGRQKGI